MILSRKSITQENLAQEIIDGREHWDSSVKRSTFLAAYAFLTAIVCKMPIAGAWAGPRHLCKKNEQNRQTGGKKQTQNQKTLRFVWIIDMVH